MWFCARLPTQAEEKHSRAPKARAEKNRCVLCEFYVEMHSCEAGLSKQRTTRQPSENAPESRAHEYVISRAPPRYKRSIRERRRRERRKFGTFYLCLRGWFSRKTARTRQSFETLQSHALTNTRLCASFPTQKEKEEYSRAPKARAEKILVRFTYDIREDAHRIVRGWF